MARMGHDEPKQSPAELFNPANWGVVGWAWVMLFVVAGTGIFVVVYQSSVAPEPAPSNDRQVRRSAPPRQAKARREEADGSDYQPRPEAYRDQGRASGGEQGSSGSSGANNPGGDDGDWDRSQDPDAQEAQFPKVFSGQHQNRTTSFKSPGKIKVQWSTTGPMIQVYAKKSGGGSAGAVVSQSGLSGTSSGEATVSVEGEIYFKVNSLGDWEVKVDSV